MPILRIKQPDGTWMEIPALVGPKGDSFTYEDFTPEQLASLKGETGEVDYSRLEDYATKKKVEDDIAEHNTSPNAHNDIRLLIEGLTNRLNALANSDDTTLDQMAEVVAYIKDNRDLIRQITTDKVNVADIVNNLTTNVANKPLSAAQGVALKALIDAITVPTKVSQLENDKQYLTSYTETDPTVPAWAKAASKPSYTAEEVGARPNTWMPNATDVGARPNTWMPSASDVGALPNTTTIPTKTSQLTNDSGFLTSAPVSSVNGKTGVVQLGASDVGARPNNWTPSVSEIADFPTSLPASDVYSWAKAQTKPSYTANEVGAVKYEYFAGDMNALIDDGHYRLDVNANLPAEAQYGQALVMKGAVWADTTVQIVFGYRNGYMAWRGGQIVNGAWNWSVWGEFFHSGNTSKENWTFTLEDGTKVTKAVYIG